MSGGDVIRLLNQAGLVARLIDGRVLISPAYRLTPAVRELVAINRESLVESLEKFGILNQVDPDARGVSYERRMRSLPLSAFREGN